MEKPIEILKKNDNGIEREVSIYSSGRIDMYIRRGDWRLIISGIKKEEIMLRYRKYLERRGVPYSVLEELAGA